MCLFLQNCSETDIPNGLTADNVAECREELLRQREEAKKDPKKVEKFSIITKFKQ